MNAPLVTVVVPIFNVSEYVEECLISVLNQTYRNLEILCVDDCGTDNSIEIVQKYQTDSRLKIIKNQRNLGLGASRNEGVNQALGEYVFFLDSDDFIKNDTIKTLVELALQSDADIAFSGATAFLHQNNPSNTYSTPEEKKLSTYIENLNQSLNIKPIEITVSSEKFLYALKQIPCVAWGKLYKTSFLRRNRIEFVKDKVLHEDNGYHIKCMSCAPKVATVSECKYQYRIRPKSIMWNAANDERKRLEHLKLSLNDALNFLCIQKKSIEYSNIVKDVYWNMYALKNSFLTYYMGQFEKRIRLLGINLLKQSSKDGRIVKTSIFGIGLHNFSLW